MVEFPPYEIGMKIGRHEFEKPFANGQIYASCFKNGSMNIASTTRASTPPLVISRQQAA